MKYRISFVVDVPEDVDPSALLDGAIMAQPDLVACLEAEGRVGGDYTADENETSVEPKSDPV
jgi:hypothetical protein